MPTSDTPVHPLIQERYPRFEGAVGDIDGTHIPIKVPALLEDENCNRKGVVTTNFLAICDFNFKFVYLLPGFSGSVHDSRVFREAKLHFGLTCPAGCYYLGDLGYPNCDAVLTPYRGILYHTEAWRRTGNKIILRKPICVLQVLRQNHHSFKTSRLSRHFLKISSLWASEICGSTWRNWATVLISPALRPISVSLSLLTSITRISLSRTPITASSLSRTPIMASSLSRTDRLASLRLICLPSLSSSCSLFFSSLRYLAFPS